MWFWKALQLKIDPRIGIDALQDLTRDRAGHKVARLIGIAQDGMGKILSVEIKWPGGARCHHDAWAKPLQQAPRVIITRVAHRRGTAICAEPWKISERPRAGSSGATHQYAQKQNAKGQSKNRSSPPHPAKRRVSPLELLTHRSASIHPNESHHVSCEDRPSEHGMGHKVVSRFVSAAILTC